MNRRRLRLSILLVLVAAIAGGIWYASRSKPVKVVVQTAALGTVESTVANTRAGTVKACRRAKLSPASGGQIAELRVHEGDHVKKGDLIVALWNEDQQANIALAESEITANKARAEAACLQAAVADREAQRLLRLRKSGAVSEDRVDQAVTDARARQADCAAAHATAKVSEARLGVAKALYDRTLLIAPFDGVIAQVNGELNEYVTPSPPGIPTLPVVDLIDNSCFYVSAPIDEVDTPAIKRGMEARITLDAFPHQHFAGTVRRISDFVLEREKQARTVDVEVQFTNPQDTARLLAGYSADAEIILAVKHDVLRVPTAAVQDGDRVLVFNPETKTLDEHTIKKGMANWDYTEVLSGLQAGDRVVVSLDRAGVVAGAHASIERTQ